MELKSSVIHQEKYNMAKKKQIAFFGGTGGLGKPLTKLLSKKYDIYESYIYWY